MSSEGAPRATNEGRGHPETGQLIRFPDARSFGPLSWRTVRVTSMAVLILLLAGALMELYLWHLARDPQGAPSSAEQVPS